VGSSRFAEAAGVEMTLVADAVESDEAQGHTMIIVARDGSLLGTIALGDALRPDAADTVARLQSMSIRTAHHIAQQAGIDEVHAGVLPEQTEASIYDMRRIWQASLI
jgi:cation transport ATPase